MADTAVGIAFQGKDQVTPVVRGIKSTMDRFKRDAATGFGLGAGISVFDLATRGVGMLVDGIGDAVKAASDLAESQSKVNVVFADGAEEVHDWAEEAATSMGMARREALEAAGTFGNFIQALGNSREEAQDMSMTLVKLAADLGSFNNTDISEVILALRSGLAGEAEPMRRLGVSISATRVEANILAKGLAKTKAEITDAMKVSERYAIIMQDTALAQGDFERTSGGLANQTKILNAQLSTASEEIGEKLVPILLTLTKVANDNVIPALDAVADSLGFVTGQSEYTLTVQDILADQAAKTAKEAAMAAGIFTHWGVSLDKVAVAAGPVADEAESLADEAKEAADKAKKLNDAMHSLADGGLAEVRKGAKAAAKNIRDLLHGGDERKSVRQLRAELKALEAQKRKAARLGRVEAFAAISDREAIIRGILGERATARAGMQEFRRQAAEKKRRLEELAEQADNMPDARIPVVLTGAERAAMALRALVVDSHITPDITGGRGAGNPSGRRRASGGPVSAGGTYLVGERGPELLTMGASSGHITPNHRMGGGHGHDIYLDGKRVGRAVDRRLGDRWAMSGAGDQYRSA